MARAGKKSEMREWIVGLGLPGLCLGLGFGFMGILNFTLGVIVSYGAFLFLVWDWMRLTRRKPVVKFIGCIVMAVIIAWFSWFVFRPSPLLIEIQQVGTGYSGEAAGIQWLPDFGEIRIRLTNSTDRDYEDLDVDFESGVEIMQMAQVSNWADVTFQPSPPKPGEILLNPFEVKKPFEPSGATADEGGISGLEGRDPHTGESSKLPVIPSANRPSSGYRIQCSKLPKHATLEFVAAIARLNPPIAGQLPGILFARLGSVKCMRLTGSYKSYNKELKVESLCRSN
jgi:hypothetical protein